MKVILTQTVPSLGHVGELKDVADGYARNYLIPRGLAKPATHGALKQVAVEKQAVARKQAKAQSEVKELATEVGRTQLVFKAKVGEQHRLFGSITAGDIADELSRQVGRPIDKHHVELAEPIRHLGEFKVPIRLAPKVEPSVTVVVEPE
ncbi:MAG TPA: 50S ribosomal protein L9 [Chloroflexota bacterium]|nr:50S ribosomal protein L9 [Chloroflexota bacterium]